MAPKQAPLSFAAKGESMRVAATALTCFIAMPCAWAQSHPPATVPASTPTPTPAAAEKPYEASLEVAPSWTSQSPFDYAETTEATAVTLSFSAKQKIVPGLTGTLTLAPSARLDSDHDDPDRGSSMGISGKLKMDASHGFALVGGFGYKASFTDLFGDNAGKERTALTGIEFSRLLNYYYPVNKGCPAELKCTLTASLTYNFTDSTDPLKDQEWAQAKAGFSFPFATGINLDAEAILARRWFSNVDPAFGTRQRRDDWAINAGVDIAELVKPWLRLGGAEELISKIKISYQYFERDSNQPGKDKRASSPSFTLALKKAF